MGDAVGLAGAFFTAPDGLRGVGVPAVPGVDELLELARAVMVALTLLLRPARMASVDSASITEPKMTSIRSRGFTRLPISNTAG